MEGLTRGGHVVVVSLMLAFELKEFKVTTLGAVRIGTARMRARSVHRATAMLAVKKYTGRGERFVGMMAQHHFAFIHFGVAFFGGGRCDVQMLCQALDVVL